MCARIEDVVNSRANDLKEGDVPAVQAATDARIADLKRAGKIRVALYSPQYRKDQKPGELREWTIELARALAERIGVEFVPIEYPTPPKAIEGLKTRFAMWGSER